MFVNFVGIALVLLSAEIAKRFKTCGALLFGIGIVMCMMETV